MAYSKRLHIVLPFILIFLLSASWYIYFQAEDLIRGPILTVTVPENGTSVNNSLVEVEGRARNISRISMNDRQIFIDEEGVFKEKLLLSYGYNIITVSAEDKFGREIERKLHLIYK